MDYKLVIASLALTFVVVLTAVFVIEANKVNLPTYDISIKKPIPTIVSYNEEGYANALVTQNKVAYLDVEKVKKLFD